MLRRARLSSFLLMAVFASSAGVVACSGGAHKTPQHGAGRSELALPPAAKKLMVEKPGLPTSSAAPALVGLMKAELERAFNELKGRAKPPPYYLSYDVSERREFAVTASLGALSESNDQSYRLLDVGLRVGSPALDNTHGSYETGYYEGSHPFPASDDELASRRALWLATEQHYNRASEQLVRVQAQRQVNVREEDESDDFSPRAPETHFQTAPELAIDGRRWEDMARRLSTLVRGAEHVERSYVRVQIDSETRYFVDSEGSTLQVPRTHARISFGAFTTASDGDELGRELNFDAHVPQDLADEATIAARIKRAIAELAALQKAPLAAPYLGPAILDGPAAAVFFHEILGHRVEGHRQKSEFEGQTFAKRVGDQVMPHGFDVYDDPNVLRVNGTDLNGFYFFDSEAVRAQRASIIEDGVLKGFVMSRSPIARFPSSNGHGRKETGYRAVSRQANLIMEPARVTTLPALKAALLDEIRRQKKPYGMRIGEVTGGYTMTERGNPQAFQIAPVMVYRVYPDGREELVRGVTLEGMPQSVMARVLAAADDFYVFNGFCGAESGQVPASAVSPSLLVGQIEVARQQKGLDRPPLLPPPPAAGGAK